jgi:thiamine biosynthesis lipoprotein
MAGRAPSDVRPAWEFAATGTRWRIYHDGSLPAAAAEQAVAAVAADEARWSRFRADSECSAINRSAGRWMTVTPETFDLLSACVEWTARTGRVFDPLCGRALRAWGYDRSFTGEGHPGCERSPEPRAVSGRIDLDRAGRRVRLPIDSHLDLGGIGKGWIAQRLARLLTRVEGCARILIDAGGDLVAVSGEHRVAIESAQADGPAVLGFVTLAPGEAIATSGFSHRHWTNGDGQAAHHLIDPRTGAPGPRVHATVIAADPVTADILAKVLALRPQSVTGLAERSLVQYSDAILTSDSWRLER